MRFLPTQPVLQLITSCLYPSAKYAPPLPPPAPQDQGQSASGATLSDAKGIAAMQTPADGDDEPAEVDEEMALDPVPPSAPSEAAVPLPLADEDTDMASSDLLRSPYAHDTYPLVSMFRAEYCRRHGWAKEDPLGVVVDLGSRGGALNVIEKARRVMGEHLGNVRQWEELPVSYGPVRRESRG